jgi:hypothetical protein
VSGDGGLVVSKTCFNEERQERKQQINVRGWDWSSAPELHIWEALGSITSTAKTKQNKTVKKSKTDVVEN